MFQFDITFLNKYCADNHVCAEKALQDNLFLIEKKFICELSGIDGADYFFTIYGILRYDYDKERFTIINRKNDYMALISDILQTVYVSSDHTIFDVLEAYGLADLSMLEAFPRYDDNSDDNEDSMVTV